MLIKPGVFSPHCPKPVCKCERMYPIRVAVCATVTQCGIHGIIVLLS